MYANVEDAQAPALVEPNVELSPLHHSPSASPEVSHPSTMPAASPIGSTTSQVLVQKYVNSFNVL